MSPQATKLRKSAKLPSPRWQVILLAAMLSVAMILIRFAIEDPHEPVFLLGILPVAMVALEWGRGWGLLAALIASAVVTVWLKATEIDLTVFGFLIRYVTFFVVGGGLGHYSTQLRRQNELLADITEATPDVIFVKDSHSRYRLMNEASVRVFEKRSEKEILGKRDQDLLPAELVGRFAAIEDEARRSPRPITREIRFKAGRSQREKIYLAVVGPLSESSGSIFSVARDVTAERASERELRRAAQHFELAGDMMCTLSIDGVFLDLNDRWREILGWSREELTGRDVRELLHPDDLKRLPEREEEFKTKRLDQYESRIRDKSGGYKWLSWTSAADPEVGVIYAVARDITDYKEAEQMKSEFFALISHELRTPLTSITGYLELAAEAEPEGEQKEFLEIIERNTKRLTRLVGDLLYVARLESGDEMYVDKREIELGAVVRGAVDSAQPATNAAGVALELVGSDEEVWISGDKGRLGQAVDNLISNAVKFTPKGGRVTVETARGVGSDEARVIVTDTGPGISKADQKHLFERFFRTDSARSSAIPGVGLGLPICEAIASQHGGRMEVSSDPGSGAEFTLVVKTGRGAE